MSLSLVVLAMGGFAQASGIRFIFPEFTKLYADGGMFNTYMVGMGYDHDFDDHLSMGVEFALDLQRATNDNTATGFTKEITYQGYSAYCTGYDKLLGFKYRTAYAFGGNDETHFYMGSFVGVRRYRHEVDLLLSSYSPGQGNGPFVRNASASKTLFPVGLRFGLRGGLEGGYGDLYTDLGYVIGGGESAFKEPDLGGEGFDLSSLNFTLGLAFGFGW